MVERPLGTGAVDLDAIPAAIDRLLVVAHGPVAPTRYVVTAGTDRFAVLVNRSAGLPARVVLEFYRRGPDWKIRAVDEGYAGGLAELGRHHGLALPAPSATTPARARVPAAPVTDPAPEDRLWAAERLLRRVSGLWEDTARSAASYRDAVAFAEHRRDRELEALLTDPAARRVDHPARLDVEQRARQLIGTAATRRFKDLDALSTELGNLESDLPAPAAPWGHPAWRQPLPEQGIGVIRVGQVTGPDGGDPALPLLRYIGAGGRVVRGARC